MDPLGLSFMPGENGSADPNGQKPSPIQQAIQTLSLRIPRTVGSGSPVPGELLNSPGSGFLGGNPNANAILEQIRRMLFGGGGANFGHPGGPIPPDGPTPPMGLPGAPIPGGPPAPRPNDPGAPVRLPPRVTVGDPTPPGEKPVDAAPTAPPVPTPGGLNAGFFERGPRNKSL